MARGSITKSKRTSGAVWEFRWRETGESGKRRLRCMVIGPVSKFPKERDALAHIKDLRDSLERGSKSPIFTFGRLVEHYREKELPKPNKTEKTRVTYAGYLKNWIEPRWGEMSLHQIKAVDVEDWLPTLKAEDGTRAKIRNIMSAVFKHGIRHEITSRNPITSVRQGSRRAKAPVVLEVSELQKLFAVLNLRERTMILVDALTGMRRGELIGLKWKDVDFVGGQIRIERSLVDGVVGKCKTEVSKKPVPMHEHLAQVLLSWYRESTYTGSEDWVFASPKSQGRLPYWPATLMRYFIRPAAKRAGIEKVFGWHTFRHTFATLLKSLGQDGKVIQELLRHASLKTSMDGYTQAMEDNKRAAQDALVRRMM